MDLTVDSIASSEADKTEEIDTKEETSIDDEDERMWAALSFVVILIIIGLPLWWKMTEVERSYFPYDEISNLKYENVSFPFTLCICTTHSGLGVQLQNSLQKLFSSSDLFAMNYQLRSFPNEIQNKSIHDLEDIETLHVDQPNFLFLLESSFSSNNNIIIGRHRTAYFKKEILANELYNFLQETVLHEKILIESIRAVTHPGYTSENLNFLRKMRPYPKYDVIFTVVNPEPENVEFDWNSAVILEHFFRPLLTQLHLLSDFRIKSQWLYLVNLQQMPKKVEDHFELSHKQIPHIITPLEKKIGSGVAKNPCINFVLYVSKCEHSPMVFVDDQYKPTNAVLSARWGGVQLVNPNSTNCVERQPLKVNPNSVMKVFLTQFKTLLGLSDFSFNTKVLPSKQGAQIYPWEMDGLYRMRILEQFISSRITLTSLSQLLGEISNIVITNEVGNAVLEGVNTAKETLAFLKTGSLVEALNFSTSSFIHSEFAFTHPSLLALLYFPDDQKYAVYIPLYLPVMIPVLLSLKNIYNWLKKKLFKTTESEKKDQ